MFADQTMIIEVVVMIVRMDHRACSVLDASFRPVRVCGYQPAMRQHEQGPDQEGEKAAHPRQVARSLLSEQRKETRLFMPSV